MFQVKKQFSVPQKQLKDWYSKSVLERNELNNQVIDQKLISWDEMLDNTPVRKIKPFHIKTNMVFFHVPKTAGTTLDFVISKNLPIWGLFKQHGADFDRNVAAFYKSGDGPKAVLGHNELNDYFYQLLTRERLVHITTLRDPVKRVISYYDFLRAQEHHPSHEVAKNKGLAAFVESPKADEVNNAQTFRILGLLKKKEYLKYGLYDQSLVDQAVDQIINRFTLFGTTKYFDAFLLMLSKLLNWDDVYYQRQNVTNKKIKTDFNQLEQAEIDKVKEFNQMDMAVYAQIEKEFERRMEVMGITSEVLDQFQERNAKYQALIKLNKQY